MTRDEAFLEYEEALAKINKEAYEATELARARLHEQLNIVRTELHKELKAVRALQQKARRGKQKENYEDGKAGSLRLP